MNETYKQLMILPEGELTPGQKDFLAVHNEMLMAGRKAADCLIIMAKDMKKMRDEELYKEAGFATFKEYVEDALEIKERQAYNWISVLDLPPEKLQLHAGMGVTKLALIASASPSVQEEVLSDEDVESATVKQLRDRIKELEDADKEKTSQLDIFIEEKNRNKIELDKAKREKADVENSHKRLADNLRHVEDALDAAKKAQQDAEKLVAEKNERIKELEDSLSAAAAPAEPQTVEVEVEKIVDNPETIKELDAAREELRQLKENSANAKKTAEALAMFKANLITMNDSLDKCLEAIDHIEESDVDLAEKCTQKLWGFRDAISNVLGG